MTKVKNAIEKHFTVDCGDVTWKSNSTDKIDVTCKVCKVAHNCMIRNLYAYVRDSEKPCRYCSKSKCRDAIEEHFEILSEGVKLTTNSSDIVKLKCLANGHITETSVHSAYVNCTTNKVINKCTMCNKPYKNEFKNIILGSGKFESIKFESIVYYRLPGDDKEKWKFYDAKLVTKEGESCYVEMDGPEHANNAKVIENDELKEDIAQHPVIRIFVDNGEFDPSDICKHILESLRK